MWPGFFSREQSLELNPAWANICCNTKTPFRSIRPKDAKTREVGKTISLRNFSSPRHSTVLCCPGGLGRHPSSVCDTPRSRTAWMEPCGMEIKPPKPTPASENQHADNHHLGQRTYISSIIPNLLYQFLVFQGFSSLTRLPPPADGQWQSPD